MFFSCGTQIYFSFFSKVHFTFAYPARALRALGLLLADSTPTVGSWIDASAKFFFTGTAMTRRQKSKNWSLRATNGPLTKIGVICQKSDFWAKNQDLGPKKLTSGWTPCSGHDREKLCKQNSTLFRNVYLVYLAPCPTKEQCKQEAQAVFPLRGYQNFCFFP